MKDTIMKILFTAVGLALFTLMITGGLWGDANTMKGKKDTAVRSVTIPTN